MRTDNLDKEQSSFFDFAEAAETLESIKKKISVCGYLICL